MLLDYYLSTLVSPLILHILLFVEQPHLTELSQILFLYILFLTRHADSENTEKPVAVQEDFINTQEFDGLYEWIPGWCQEFRLPDSKEELRYMYTLLLSLRKQKIACQDQILDKMRHPIKEILKEIRQSKKNYLLFSKYMEALIAFHKYYGGKEQ